MQTVANLLDNFRHINGGDDDAAALLGEIKERQDIEADTHGEGFGDIYHHHLKLMERVAR